MNQPDRYERFVLPDGATKVSYVTDTKIPNAAMFTMLQEDHTLGNMIRMLLFDNPRIVFAGYRIPHPLVAKLEVRVQTNGEETPVDAFLGGVRSLNMEFADIVRQFKSEAEKHRKTTGGTGAV